MDEHEKQLYLKLKELLLHGYRENDIQLVHLAVDYGVNYRDAEDILVEALADAACKVFTEWQKARTAFCEYLGIDTSKIHPPWDSDDKLWQLRTEIGTFADIVMRMNPDFHDEDDDSDPYGEDVYLLRDHDAYEDEDSDLYDDGYWGDDFDEGSDLEDEIDRKADLIAHGRL